MSIPKRPKSKFEDENGLILLNFTSDEKDYPEVYEWERQYAIECDRLSASYAAKKRRHWGRWFLDRKYLCTYISRPGIGEGTDYRGSTYDIELRRIGPNGESDGGTYTWYEHMAEKNWIGEQGLADLKRAVSEIKH